MVLQTMEKYENLGLVGEGSYGMVLKCRHKESGQLVAIKKFLESEDDKMVKKIAIREIKMLRQLRHENLVNLLEVFRRKKRLYLVFEFVDHTVLDDLERCPNGLDENTTRKVLWQVLSGIDFCHAHNIIHRDVKPENILVSKNGVVKLCDFGFARTLAQPGENYTDYVATRWYRAPELLVGDTKYGRAVDIWAVGCLIAEMLTGEPLFPGDSDIDQLFHIVKCFGFLTQRHKEIFQKNPLFVGMRLPEAKEIEPLHIRFPRMSVHALDLMKQSLRLEPNDRPSCSELLRHGYFTHDSFATRFPQDLHNKLRKERENNPLLTRFTQQQNARAEEEGVSSSKKKKKEDREREKKKNEATPKENGSSREAAELADKAERQRRKEQEDVERRKKQTPPLKKETPRKVGSPSKEDGHMPPINHSNAHSTSSPSHAYVLSTPALAHSVVNPTMNTHAIGPPPIRMGERIKVTSMYKKAPLVGGGMMMGGDKPARGDDRRDDHLVLPELRAMEVPPSRSGSKPKGKLAMGTVPHITTLDPFGPPSK